MIKSCIATTDLPDCIRVLKVALLTQEHYCITHNNRYEILPSKMKLNCLGLLLASAAPCSAFVPASISASSHVQSRTANNVPTLRASSDDNNYTNQLEEVSKIAGSALVALTLSFSAISTPFSNEFTIPNANAYSTTSSSITISARASDVDELIVKSLEKETREVEAEAKRDAKKAKIEKSREIFFEYEAKMAEQTEARIEAAEKKAELEAETDKKLVAELDAKEKQAEKEAALASSKKEKAAKEKEARVSYMLHQSAYDTVCVCS